MGSAGVNHWKPPLVLVNVKSITRIGATWDEWNRYNRTVPVAPTICKPIRSIFVVTPIARTGTISKPTIFPVGSIVAAKRAAPSKNVRRSNKFLVSCCNCFSWMKFWTAVLIPLTVNWRTKSETILYSAQSVFPAAGSEPTLAFLAIHNFDVCITLEPAGYAVALFQFGYWYK